jgi:hypothetical protein
MRILILIGLLIAVFILFLSQSCLFGEKLKIIDPYFWNFGKVMEGSMLEHTFILKNKSRTVLIINNLQTSCGCTGSVVSDDHIPAGKTSKIKVTFNTKGYSGKAKQYVYVHTNDLHNPIIKLTVAAEVIKK